MSKGTLGAGDKYQLLLAAAQHGTCYNPECDEPLLVERVGHSITNFEFAHIRDEQKPSDADADIGWRFWPDDLAQDQRNHFSNVILLCGVCHKLVDKVDPRAFSPALLMSWKRDAEGDRGPALAATVGSMRTEALDELILRALKQSAPVRDVRVTLSAAFLDGGRAVLVPLPGVHDTIAGNPGLADLETALAVQATNDGGLPAAVVSFDLEFRRAGREHHPVLASPNPVGINPVVPVALPAGACETWIFHTAQLSASVTKFGASAVFTELVGVARLATGERCLSDPVGAEDVPMWHDVSAIAEVVAKIRAADESGAAP